MIERAIRRLSLRGLTAGVVALFLIATITTGVSILAANRVTVAQLVDRRIDAISDVVLERDPGEGLPATATLLARIGALSRERDTGDIGLLLTGPMRRGWAQYPLNRPLPIGRSDLRHATASSACRMAARWSAMRARDGG